MDICERIKTLIESQNMNIAAFARKIGVGDQTIRGVVVQKRNKPGYDVILKIVQTFEWLNVEWLITGKGDMRKGAEPSGEESEPDMNMKLFLDYLRKKDEKIEKLLEENITMRLQLNVPERRANMEQIMNVVRQHGRPGTGHIGDL